ncbi:MAG TPA: transcriptional repressor LexA [Arenimonas sp.]|uniref:transcriptional repressor LexA n=1 Tax=Arenimonas sp. TaxID=1872635 RepID=UPI002D7EBA0A|nr:transcriptional repressor LexA [Arenimonas sp.]HEU0152488.1 transcriptional repressor LexA [Arenimonas sp.]
MSPDLTPRQQALYDFIAQRLRTEGAPSVAEIARAFGIHDSAAHKHLRTLEAKGALVLLPGRARGIRLPAAASRKATRRDDMLSLPILGRVAAGAPIGAAAGHDGQMLFDRAAFFPQPDYLLRVKGDSMRDDGILDGDLIAVHRSDVAEDGQIVVARIDGEITVKRLRRKRDRILLMPRNPDYAPIEVPADAEFAIEGLYCGLVRRG